LDVEQTELDSGTSAASLESKLSRHTLGRATLTGIFERH
ncbi:conserved hypothetical protein, partial [Arthrobacter sp. Hiyo6]